jgi:hypothetical protein
MANQSLGKYKGVDIAPGSQADIQSQMAKIDASTKPTAPTTAQPTPTQQKQGSTPSTSSGKNTGVANIPITSANLAPAAPIVPQSAPTPTNGAALAGTIDAQAMQYANSVVNSADLEKTRGNMNTSLSSLLEEITGQKGKSALTDKYYTDTVDPAKKELDQINNDILAEQTSLRRRQELIEKNSRGATAEGLNQELRAVEKESLSKQADLSIIQMAKQNNYYGAKEIADRKVAAQLEDQAQRIQILQFTYQENKELFNKQEQRQFETQQNERVRLLEKESTELKAVNDLAINALQNGAPVDVVRRMQTAKTQDEALSYGGQYVGKLDRDTQLLTQQKLRSEITAANDAKVAMANVQALTQNGDPVSSKQALATLLASGDISPATKGRLAPAVGVLNAVDEFSNSNVEGKFTGAGFFGKLKEGVKGWFNAKNPEATTNAQNIEAINLKVQQWASGASLTDTQTEQVKKFTPTTWDSDKTIREKLNGLYGFMLNQAEGDLLTDGVNVNFAPVDLFEIRSLYSKASPEQKAQLEELYPSLK